MPRLLLSHYHRAPEDALIAQAIAFGIEEQTRRHTSVTVERTNASGFVGPYDGFVIGTNLSSGRWEDATQRFLDQNAAALADRPTAIYVALTGGMDSTTRSLLRNATAANRLKQFVAVRMPMRISPGNIRGIALFVPRDCAATNLLTQTLNAFFARLFRPSPDDEEYARAGRSFGRRIATRFDEDAALDPQPPQTTSARQQ